MNRRQAKKKFEYTISRKKFCRITARWFRKMRRVVKRDMYYDMWEKRQNE